MEMARISNVVYELRDSKNINRKTKATKINLIILRTRNVF